MARVLLSVAGLGELGALLFFLGGGVKFGTPPLFIG